MSRRDAAQALRRGSSHRSARRFTGFAGLTFAILYQVGNSGLASLPGAPSGVESDQDLARYFADHSDGVLGFAVLVVVSTAFLIWFAYGFRRALLSIAPSAAAISGEVVLGAGVMSASIIVCALLLIVSAAERSSRTLLPPDTARTLWDLSNDTGLLLVFPAAGLTAAVGVVARRVPQFPRWLRLTAPPLAVLLLVVVVGWLSIKLWCIWLIALSVSLLRGRRWEWPGQG